MLKRISHIFAAFCLSIGFFIQAQAHSAAAHHQGQPVARMWASLLFVPGQEQVLLFGGGRLTDVWALDNERQVCQEQVSPNPPRIYRMGGNGAAYDYRAGQMVVLFYKGEGMAGETWAYDPRSGEWRNLRPKNQPPGRRFTHLVYLSALDKTLLFGGTLGDLSTTATSETWWYDYPTNTWEQVHPTASPPPSSYHHFAYDEESRRVILWGGKPQQEANGIWVFDPNRLVWEQVALEGGPKADYDGAAVYASDRDRTYFLVGRQFWALDLNELHWERLPLDEEIGNRYGASLGHDLKQARLVLFGGTSAGEETYFYNPDRRE